MKRSPGWCGSSPCSPSSSWTRGVLGRQANLGVDGDDRSQTVASGAVATFTFTVRAPSTVGPVIDGLTWLEDYGVYLVVDVDLGFHAASVSQSPWPTVQAGSIGGP